MDIGKEYAGRVVCLGRTPDGRAASGFKFGGRSNPSKSREFVRYDDDKVIKMRAEPLDKKEPVDEWRHYLAVIEDKQTGLLVVSNGYHTKNIFDVFGGGVETPRYTLMGVMDDIGPEDDNLSDGTPVKTPRIAGVISYQDEEPEFYLSISRPIEPGKREPWVTKVIKLNPETGQMFYVPTYNGKENEKKAPQPFELGDFTESRIPSIAIPNIKTPEELAVYLLGLFDQRFVAGTIGGLYCTEDGKWQLASADVHKR